MLSDDPNMVPVFSGDTERYKGQLDLLNIGMLQTPITVIGAGAIGSFAVLSLAKMGCGDITVFDFDSIELHNLSNQYYRTSDIGTLKVIALKNIVEDFCQIDIKAIPSRFENQAFESPILIMAVDSIDIRAKIFARLEQNPGNIKLVVDGRMGGLTGQVLAFLIDDDVRKAKYKKEFLFPKEEAAQLRCTEKSTMFTVLGISSYMSGIVASFLGKKDFAVPFERILDFSNMVSFPTAE